MYKDKKNAWEIQYTDFVSTIKKTCRPKKVDFNCATMEVVHLGGVLYRL